MADKVQEVIITIDGLIKELQRLQSTEGVASKSGTRSVSQDALRAGFQTSCYSGIAALMGVKDMTVEACKDFLPRHEEEVGNFVTNLRERAEKELKAYPDLFKRNKIADIERSYSKRYLNWYNFKNRRKYNAELRAEKAKEYPIPTITEIVVGEREMDIPNGRYHTEVQIHVHYPAVYGVKAVGKEHTEVNTHNVFTIAKRGNVRYESYNTYSKSYIPDEVVEVVKEAMEIGLTNIEVAYPYIEEGVKVGEHTPTLTKDPKAWKDPIVVGWCRKDKQDAEMYMLAWFGYDVKQPYACNI